MFEDYQSQPICPFQTKIDTLCLSQSGVFIAIGRRKVVIGHTTGCEQEIELFTYFREQMQISVKSCREAREIANKCDNKSSCCFGIILDSTFWCLIVSIDFDKHQNKRFLSIDQLKMLSVHTEEKQLGLKFVENCSPGNIVLSQNEPFLTQIVPNVNFVDKFCIKKYEKLRFVKKQDEQQSQDKFFSLKESNLIFSMFEQLIFAYCQINENHNWRNQIFFFQLESDNQNTNQNGDESTYPKHLITLPLFEDQRYLCHVQILPTQEKKQLETAFILSYYQLPQGMEIVETTFTNPSVVNRKFMYPNFQFVEFIGSNISDEKMQIKGIQTCLEQHSVIISYSSGFGLDQNIGLFNLPSTGVPKVANMLRLPKPFQLVKFNKKNIIIADQSGLTCIHRHYKSEIYKRFMKDMAQKGEFGCNIGYILKEVQQVLE